jgi:hypothetical protein
MEEKYFVWENFEEYYVDGLLMSWMFTVVIIMFTVVIIMFTLVIIMHLNMKPFFHYILSDCCFSDKNR